MARPAPSVDSTILPPLPAGWQVIAFAALANGDMAMVGANADLQSAWMRDAAGVPLGNPYRIAADAKARIWTFDGHALSEGPCFPLLTPSPVIDRFPDGRWLVASARAHDDPNARILDHGGQELSRIHLGDGIMRLNIDDAGLIWVGWFDEGVFGNTGWKFDDLAWPPSSYGLAAFDDHGRLIAHAEDAPKGSDIADCYALNVVGHVAWSCTYPDFPIAALEAGKSPRWWLTDLSGTRAIAVAPPLVLAVGGYGEDSDRVLLLRLVADSVETMGEWRLPFMAGFPERADYIDARGDCVHMIVGAAWHRWRVDDFLAASQ